MSKLGINVPAIRMKALTARPSCISRETGTHLPTVTGMTQEHRHWLMEDQAGEGRGCSDLCLSRSIELEEFGQSRGEQSFSLVHAVAASRLEVASQSSPGKLVWVCDQTTSLLPWTQQLPPQSENHGM